MPSRIEDYALIGDCETAALVGRDGAVAAEHVRRAARRRGRAGDVGARRGRTGTANVREEALATWSSRRRFP